MDEKDRQILRQNRTLLVNNLYDIHNVCEDLYSCDILTESMRSEIMAESTPIKQSRKLLDILPKRGKQAFQSFLEALVNNGQKELASKLDSSLVSTLMSNISTNSPTSIQSTKQPLAENLEANKSTSIITSPTSGKPSVVDITSQETGFQAVHGPKGVQPADVKGHKELHRQQSSSQPASELCSIKDWVEKLNISFESEDFSIMPWSDSKTRHLSQSHKHYSMPCKLHRGRVIIISNRDFKGKLPDRPHEFLDSSRLIQLFEALQFKVLPNITDLDLTATRKTLKNEAAQDHSKYDCFILAILSHGKGSSIYTADGQLISIQEIVDIFNDAGAPSLKGKPKIFIIQAAEQSGKDLFLQTHVYSMAYILQLTHLSDLHLASYISALSLVSRLLIQQEGKFILPYSTASRTLQIFFTAGMNRHDSSSSDLVDLADSLADLRIGAPKTVNVTDTKQDVVEMPSSPDILVVMGTAGYSTSHGSYFIQILSNYICKLLYECHLEEIIKKVNGLDVKDKNKELCVYKSSLSKEFYFFTST